MRSRRMSLWGALILLALTGCSGLLDQRAAQPIQPANYSLDASRKLLAVSFYALTELYVEPVSLDKLVSVGLRRLLAADPGLALIQQEEVVQLTQGQRAIASFFKPEPTDAGAWARMTAALIDAARRHSAILDTLTADRIYFEFLTGVTSQLDGISRYDDPERVRDNRAHREGFGGIGVRIAASDPRLIHAVQPDTPAARAGILAGDILLAIDGRSTQGMSSRQVVNALRGPRGSEVILILERIGATAPLARSIVRQLIVDQTIAWRRDAGDIGYIHISDFTLHTNDQLKKALNAVLKQGRPLRGMAVDLRDNPGGFLSQGTDAADLFLESGLLLTSQGRHLEANQRFNATAGDLLHGLPLILLVNGHSASAAEIMAAALQDNGRAVVIGSSTYGKGTAQKITPLDNGAELILTFARFHAPSGYRLQNRGVLPNLCTSTVGGSAEELIEMLRQGQTNPALLLAQHRTAESKPPALQKTIALSCPPFTGKRAIDLELDVAHRLLANSALFQRALRGTAMNSARRD